jgi:hypothetical protein
VVGGVVLCDWAFVWGVNGFCGRTEVERETVAEASWWLGGPLSHEQPGQHPPRPAETGRRWHRECRGLPDHAAHLRAGCRVVGAASVVGEGGVAGGRLR